jgi:hypothetical protein
LKLLGWIALVAVLLAAVPQASAKQGGGGRQGGGRGDGLFAQPGGRPNAARQEELFTERQQAIEQSKGLRNDLRGDYWRNDSNSGRCDGPCRMSPEERRQLRHDIDKAGRDLYRGDSRRGRD